MNCHPNFRMEYKIVSRLKVGSSLILPQQNQTGLHCHMMSQIIPH